MTRQEIINQIIGEKWKLSYDECYTWLVGLIKKNKVIMSNEDALAYHIAWLNERKKYFKKVADMPNSPLRNMHVPKDALYHFNLNTFRIVK